MAKKQAMKQLQNPKVGDKCVVADFVGTVIYTIADIYPAARIAELTYPSGDKMVSGGQHPLSCCYVPTKEQLAAPQ